MIDSIKKHGLLLTVLTVICIVKFIVVPIYTWQQDIISENLMLEKRLVKSLNALNNLPETERGLIEIEARIAEIQNIIFPFQAENLFQLQQQQSIEKIFDSQTIKISNLGWQLPYRLKEHPIIEHEVNISFSGEVVNLQQLQVMLEQKEQWFNISELNYRFEKKRAKRLGDVNGRMKVKLYMRDSE